MIIKWFLISVVLFVISYAFYKTGINLSIEQKDDDHRGTANKKFCPIMTINFLSIIISCIAMIIVFL